MLAIVNFCFMEKNKNKKRKLIDIGYFGGGCWYNTDYEIIIKQK